MRLKPQDGQVPLDGAQMSFTLTLGSAGRVLDGVDPAEQATAPTILDATLGGELIVPGGAFLLIADYDRVGADLVLSGGADRHVVVIRDFFALEHAPTLRTEAGAEVSGALAARLAGAPAPGQYAAAGDGAVAEPIGKVIDIVGETEVIHADGTRETLAKDMPVYQGDVVETGDEAALKLVFVDESTLSVGDNGRMVLDELVFDPSSLKGSSAVSVLQGLFVFVSGEIAQYNPEQITIRTPVGLIGVRGTAGAVQAAQEGEDNRIVLLPEKASDGQETVGAVKVSNQAGSVVLDEAYETTMVDSIFSLPSDPYLSSPEEIAFLLRRLKGALPDSLEFLAPEGGAGGRGADAGALGEAGFALDAIPTIAPAAGSASPGDQAEAPAEGNPSIPDATVNVTEASVLEPSGFAPTFEPGPPQPPITPITPIALAAPPAPPATQTEPDTGGSTGDNGLPPAPVGPPSVVVPPQINNPPTVVGLANTTASIAENTDILLGLKVADIVVTDDAFGANALALVGPDTSSFEIIGTELRLKPGLVLDFETQALYQVQVTADDLAVGGTPDATSGQFIFQVTNLNEAPLITQLAGPTAGNPIFVAENTAGTFIAITATDPENQTLTFSIGANPNASFDNTFFTVDSATGALSFANPPDFEFTDPGDDDLYKVRVTVTDTQAASTFRDYFVQVTDQNEVATGGNDLLFGTAGSDVIDALGGNDTVFGNLGDDQLLGSSGDDNLFGEGGNDTLSGGSGFDILSDTQGDETYSFDISDLDGSDDGIVDSDGAADRLVFTGFGASAFRVADNLVFDFESLGSATILNHFAGNTIELFEVDYGFGQRTLNLATNQTGGGGDDFVVATFNVSSTLIGDGGNDILLGSGANDVLSGDAGDDFIMGEEGIDEMTGGIGADAFIYGGPSHGVVTNANGAFNDPRDQIFDYTSGQDFFAISGFDFGFGTFEGSLATLEIDLNTTLFFVQSNYDGTGIPAAPGQPHFVFDDVGSTLYYDDNSATAGYTVIAQVPNGANLSSADIVLSDFNAPT